ncbi:MAG: MBL fold metallo-hydrolase [Thermodesulfobacteriota bacterium]
MIFMLSIPVFLILMVTISFITGCGRYWDLAKIVAKNITYEVRYPIQPPKTQLRIPPRANPGIHVGWVGHSTFLISFLGIYILTDPNFAERLLIARRVVGLPIKPEEISELDIILITHAHYDHFDLESLKRLPKKSHLIIPRGCLDLVSKWPFLKVIEMSWEDRKEIQNVQIEAFRPAHWGKRSFFDNKDRGYNSYLISKQGRHILFAGDTGYTPIFAQKGKNIKIDLAFFPITAYKPDWFRRNHASPEEALQMFIESGAKFMIPMHWGTFILSHEPLPEPVERLQKEARRLGIDDRVIILEHGETFTFPDNFY